MNSLFTKRRWLIGIFVIPVTCCQVLPAEDDQAAKLVQTVADDKHAMIIMTGGGFIGTDVEQLMNMPHQIESGVNAIARAVEQNNGIPDSVQKVIAASNIENSKPRIIEELNRKLSTIDPTSVGAVHLVLVAGQIGNRDTVPGVIDLYRRAFQWKPEPGVADPLDFEKKYRQALVVKNSTWALWELTGRKKVQRPDEWVKWWEAVETFFESGTGRTVTRPLPAEFDDVVKRLQTEPDVAIEQLIAIGPSGIEELLKRLPEASESDSFHICTAIDEMGATEQLSPAVQRVYFVKRFTRKPDPASMGANLKDARLRALYHTRFVDYCRIVMETDRVLEGIAAPDMRWHYSNLTARDFSKKYGTSSYAGKGGWLDKKTIKLQIGEAVPVIVEGLKDESPAVRRAAGRLSQMIAMGTDENPEALIIALRDAWLDEEWLKEPEKFNSSNFGYELSRYDSPIVTKALREGLYSVHESIVRTSANEIDRRRFPPEQNVALYDRLEELVEHENSRMRFASVRTLRSAEPKRLVEHFEFLRQDTDKDVLSELCRAINALKNPMHQGILVDLALNHDNEYLRHDALDALAEPEFDSAMDELLPLLDDERMAGFVLHTIVRSKGKDALPILFGMIEEGKDRGNFVMQYLPRLTSEQFKTKEEWLEWWNTQPKE